MDVMEGLSRYRQLRGLLVLGALALAACATTPVPPSEYGALFGTARDLADAGRIEAVLKTDRRAAADGSRKELWQQMGALDYAAGRPVAALVAAEDILQRDPADVSANRAFIASGMQIAQEAMQRLLAAVAKPDDDDLLRAQQPVKQMGQVFGEDRLVSDQARARYASRAVQQYRAAQAGQSRTPTPEEKSKPLREPFQVLARTNPTGPQLNECGALSVAIWQPRVETRGFA